MRFSLALLASLAAMPALADNATVTPANTLTAPPTAWLGEMPHLVIMGQVGDYTFDVQVLDPTVAAALEGKREYLPDGGTFRYGDFEVALAVVIDGIEKVIEIEFENHDFNAHPVPADFALQGEEFPEGLLSNMEVEFEWESAGVSVNEELPGWTGTLTRTMDTGTADDQGLVPDGMLAGFVTATRADGALVISFTVPVAAYEIDD